MSYTGPINPFPNAKHLPVSLYGYVPNQGFNIFAAIAWGLVLAAHFWWLYKKGPRGAQSLVVFGCIWELIGHSIRVDTHSEPFCADLFIAQYAMLHTAPVFFVMALVNAIAWGMEGTDDASVYDRFRPRAFAGSECFLLDTGSTSSRHCIIAGSSSLLSNRSGVGHQAKTEY